jgi:hypothetical protein
MAPLLSFLPSLSEPPACPSTHTSYLQLPRYIRISSWHF